jgi:hypothetical protein
LPFVFSGHPSYLVAAGRELGLPIHVVDRARRPLSVSDAAGLLSQATTVHPAARREILSHARERIDAFRVAWTAAEAMYRDVQESLFPPEPTEVAGSFGVEPVEAELTPEPFKPRRTRKADL